MPQRQELLKLEDVFRLVLKKLSYTWKKMWTATYPELSSLY
ncbi:hypothetical protein P7H16_05670 [Paenibacillus larvae]|nr:hypothetical protein [Paenibacillus larvae]MDT2246558.1 hypothetical protein [Paenibacillus larvae]